MYSQAHAIDVLHVYFVDHTYTVIVVVSAESHAYPMIFQRPKWLAKAAGYLLHTMTICEIQMHTMRYAPVRDI